MVVLLSLIMALAAASVPASSNPAAPPVVSIQQLRSGSALALPPGFASLEQSNVNLHQILFDSHGILRISVGSDDNGDDDFAGLRKRALSQLCDCPTLQSSTSSLPSISHTRQRELGNVDIVTFEEALKSHPADLQQITLPDGTVRRTLASATIGFGGLNENILELPSWVRDTCGQVAYESFEALRGIVAEVTRLFVERLDKENLGYQEQEDRSYRQILSSVTHLEHFHRYTKSGTPPLRDGNKGWGPDVLGNQVGSEKEASTLDYHTDAGFFLSFVPAMNCHAKTIDNDSFYLKGWEQPLTFQEDEVVIMLGAGAQHWLPPGSGDLQQRYPFQAASHALRLSPDTNRAWYGKMHILPSSLMAGNADVGAMHKQTHRRQLQDHVESPANCNNVTNFFCWNQCIDIPDHEQAEQYLQDGRSLYCLDPAALTSSGNSVPEATEPCEGGFIHNPDCEGGWVETDENVPGYDLMYNDDEPKEEAKDKPDEEVKEEPEDAAKVEPEEEVAQENDTGTDEGDLPDQSSATNTKTVLSLGLLGMLVCW